MKLGEALTLRKKQAEKLNDLRGRIKGNVMVQEGQNVQEDPRSLIESFEQLSEDHRTLVLAINLTNAHTSIDGGATLLEVLSQREHLIRRRNVLAIAANAATPDSSSYRYMRSELSFVPTLNVAALREEIDTLSSRITRIDIQIQEINWQTDLISV